MRQELFTIKRAGPIALLGQDGAPQSSLHASRSTGADSLGEVQSSPATGPRARRPVRGLNYQTTTIWSLTRTQVVA